MISYNLTPVDPETPNKYWYGFKIGPTTDLERITKCMTNFVWSPIIWSSGRRKETNFVAAHFLVLDFDDGMTTMQDADENIFADYKRIIAPTKSHTEEHHRFRVLIPFDKPIKKLDQYRENLRTCADHYSADPKSCDGARYFYPSTRVYTTRTDGECWQAIDYPPRPPKPPIDYRWYQGKKTIPCWVQGLLNYGVPEGTRNTSCFKIGAQLARYGHAENEVVSILMRSSVPIGSSEKVEREVAQAVHSGFKTVRD